MPLGLAVAASYSPLLYRPRDQWKSINQLLVGSVPQPYQATNEETDEVLDHYAARIEAAFSALRQQLQWYRPDALIVLACDHGRMFNESNTPQIHVHVGSEIWGSTRYTDLGEAESASARVTIPCHEELAEWLARDIVFDGIDANQSRGQFNPLGDPVGGVSHTLTDPLLTLLPRLDIPIVPVHLNAHVDPAITGHRLLVLGRIIGQSLEERTDRIAILASGGLSGHPRGYVAGWIDEKLDDWVLYWLRRGRSERLKTLWDQDSYILRGATREIRTWLVAGSAMEVTGARATIVDYIPFSHAAVGTAFAYWAAPAYIQAEAPMAAGASASQDRTRTPAPAI
jgi:hypothetical protein